MVYDFLSQESIANADRKMNCRNNETRYISGISYFDIEEREESRKMKHIVKNKKSLTMDEDQSKELERKYRKREKEIIEYYQQFDNREREGGGGVRGRERQGGREEKERGRGGEIRKNS